jgi:membrane associated rhomboid family serine protease
VPPVQPAEDLDAPEPWWRRQLRRPATAGLMAACILAYAATFAAALTVSPDPLATAVQSLWSLADSTDVLRRFGALELTRVWVDGEWWRVLTTGFLHGSLLHLVLNLTALSSIGEWVEDTWGAWRTLLLFVVASLAGCLASLAWSEAAIVVGASAGALGQAGALWVARRFGAPELQRRLEPVSSFRLGLLILLCLFLGTIIAGVSQAGHVGGLLAGALLGWLLSGPRPLGHQLPAGTLLALGFAALVHLGRAPAWQTHYHLLRGLRSTQDGDLLGASDHFRAALTRAPEDPSLKNTVAYALAEANLELSQAERLVREALQADPTNASYLDTLAWIWCLRGQSSEGLTLLRAALFLAHEDDPEISEHLQTCAPPPENVPRETF